MKLKLTDASIKRYEKAKLLQHQRLFGHKSPRYFDEREYRELYSKVTVQKTYGVIAVIKLPRVKTTDDTWYHVVHMPTLLVVGRVQYEDLKSFRDTFDKVRWLLDVTDPMCMTLIAMLGAVKTIFHCRLQYEYVSDDE